MTFNTSAALDGTPGSDIGPVDHGQVVEFDVTQHVTADGTYCFVITSDSQDGVDYYSREAASGQPQFLVDVTP